MVSCDRLKPYFTPEERLSLYEPNPDLEPADYECRGNKHLETLDRALPSPPSHRGCGSDRRGEDEDEEDDIQSEEPSKGLGPEGDIDRVRKEDSPVLLVRFKEE